MIQQRGFARFPRDLACKINTRLTMINERPRNLLPRKNNHNWPKNVFEFTASWKISFKLNSGACKRVHGLLSGNYNAENYTNVSRQWVINCRLSQGDVPLIIVAHSKMLHSRHDREKRNIFNGFASGSLHPRRRAPFRLYVRRRGKSVYGVCRISVPFTRFVKIDLS